MKNSSAYKALALPCLLIMLLVNVKTITVDQDKAALLIIDVQNCFLEGGTLAINEGNDVVPIIKDIRTKYREHFSLVVMTQDWHCPDHVSFASQHPGQPLFSQINLEYDSEGHLCTTDTMTSPYAQPCSSVAHHVTQTLWPDHCVINTADAEFSGILGTECTNFIVRKGYHCEVDSYSAFYDNGGFDQTVLHSKLMEANITSVYIVGLARDCCVFYTAKDAKSLGYETFVILDATRGVASDTSEEAVIKMREKGINVISSTDLEDTLPGMASPNHDLDPNPDVLNKSGMLLLNK